MKMMRVVPLWFFLFCLLCWVLFTVVFGWAVKSTLTRNSEIGMFGKIAVSIASFPTMVTKVFTEVSEYASGDYQDISIRVRREKNADYSGFIPVSKAPGINVAGLLMRAEPSRMVKGWRLFVGVFTIDGKSQNAALLMSPDYKIVKKWILDEIPVGELKPQPEYRKFVHGLEILKDGSVIFGFDNGISLQRMDVCGERKWVTPGGYNHAVTMDDFGKTVWTLDQNYTITRISVDDGRVLRRIPISAIIANNPMIDLLEIRRFHPNDLGENSRNTVGSWLPEPFHFNDVEPLSTAMAGKFPGFHVGDLLVSCRSLNLLFVLDPKTLRIKWWRVGVTQRQHDPDWSPTGTITVLNNRMSRDYSEIISINPYTLERNTLFDGRKNGFYTRIRGKHQRLDDGTLIVTSSQQGRVFEVDHDGNVVFEVVNVKPDSDTTNYAISEARWLPMDYFGGENWKCLSDI